MDKIFAMINEMLENKQHLTSRELYWIETFNSQYSINTCGEMLSKPKDIVKDIYNKYCIKAKKIPILTTKNKRDFLGFDDDIGW